jgi:hypothetical protein
MLLLSDGMLLLLLLLSMIDPAVTPGRLTISGCAGIWRCG